MTREEFEKFITNAQKYSEELDRWDKFGLSLYELPISEMGWELFNISVDIIFKEDGADWINWWLFEKPIFFGKPSQAYNEDGSVIPTDTLDDLWNLVKDLQK